MKKALCFSIVVLLVMACTGEKSTAKANSSKKTAVENTDDGKGIGEIKSVSLNNPLNEEMIKRGKAISEMKCLACHKLTDQRVVGPGWKGVTEKRKPEWVMNMITNVEIMLEKDPEARELLKLCLTRMPNQNLSIGDARDVLEFMYANDAQTDSE